MEYNVESNVESFNYLDKITPEKLERVIDASPLIWCDTIKIAMERYSINTPLRISHFLANVIHESMGFSRLTENLNYSGQRLLQVFPKYFRGVNINNYARQPQKIANRVYANRYGNGNETSGDGWRYRGRGLIQLTFKDNYRECGNAIGYDLVNNPDLLTEPMVAALSAGWYWQSRKLNGVADLNDGILICRRINGGTNGLQDRLNLQKLIYRIFFEE